MIIVQAIVGENAFTDVAYIDIQRDESGRYQVQIRERKPFTGPTPITFPVTITSPGRSFTVSGTGLLLLQFTLLLGLLSGLVFALFLRSGWILPGESFLPLPA